MFCSEDSRSKGAGAAQCEAAGGDGLPAPPDSLCPATESSEARSGSNPLGAQGAYSLSASMLSQQARGQELGWHIRKEI